MGVISLVLGIASIVLIFINGITIWASIAAGAIGIVLAALARKKGEGGIAIAGLVVSIIGTALALIWWVACASTEAALGAAIDAAGGF